MAMSKAITLDNGVYMENAYIKIREVNNVNGMRADIQVSIFMSQSYSQDDKPPVIEYSHVCDSSQYNTYFNYDKLNELGVNVVLQGYEFLKTLSFYQDAEDVMDVKE